MSRPPPEASKRLTMSNLLKFNIFVEKWINNLLEETGKQCDNSDFRNSLEFFFFIMTVLLNLQLV